jgi:hypothetical protein
MNHFDELPHRDRSHEIEDKALLAFQTRLADSGCFILQASDRKDYGTDCQIEVTAGGHATNVRVHVQLLFNHRDPTRLRRVLDDDRWNDREVVHTSESSAGRAACPALLRIAASISAPISPQTSSETILGAH